MTKRTPKTAPFLVKLYKICHELPKDVGAWAVMKRSTGTSPTPSWTSIPKQKEDGITSEHGIQQLQGQSAMTLPFALPSILVDSTKEQFEVYQPERFFEFIRTYYTGTTKTFFRQLSYFRFTKGELLPKGFSFYHDNFQRNDMQSLSLIKRISGRTKSDSDEDHGSEHDGSESNEPLRVEHLEIALNELRAKVDELTRTVAFLVQERVSYLSADSEDGVRKRHRGEGPLVGLPQPYDSRGVMIPESVGTYPPQVIMREPSMSTNEPSLPPLPPSGASGPSIMNVRSANDHWAGFLEHF